MRKVGFGQGGLEGVSEEFGNDLEGWEMMFMIFIVLDERDKIGCVRSGSCRS